MKKLSLILMVACLGFFATSCSSDKDPVPPAEKDYAKEIASTYVGNLSVQLPAEEGGLIEDKSSIEIVAATTPNKVDLVLKDFIINIGGNSLNVGTIKLTDVEVEGKDGVVNVKEKEFKDYALQNLPIEATILVKSGTVKGEELTNLVLHIDEVFKSSIIVKFSGVKGDKYTFFYDMEEWVVEHEVDGELYKEPVYSPYIDWSSSNTGAAFIMLWGDAIPGAHYNVTKTSDAYSGKYAAKIETLDTEGLDLGFVKVPKVTSGTLFTGTFKTDAMNTLNSTKFGIPFSKKPLGFKGYYKYTPGKIFYRSSVATADKGVEEKNTTDKASINAFLYEIKDDKDAPITGVDTYNDPRIVATALFEGTDTDKYTEFNKEFVYKEGKSFDKSKKYRIAIVASSSSQGDTFSGAPGSTLYLDDIEIIAE